jgi:hypothetical protein
MLSSSFTNPIWIKNVFRKMLTKKIAVWQVFPIEFFNTRHYHFLEFDIPNQMNEFQF